MLRTDKWLTAVYLTICFAVFGLACIGGVINFSSVPYWDSWDGAIRFLLRFSQGDTDVLWQQHNEHRIVLAKLLFLLEYKVFGGSGVFLRVCNYLAVVATALTLWQAMRWRNHGLVDERTCFLAAAGLLAILSLWMQAESFLWEFQIQEFLVVLLPLVALLALAKSGQRGLLRDAPFFAALVFGFLSIGTMANGLFALPLMAVGAIILRLGWVRTGLLVALAGVSFTLYFHQYTTPGGAHTSPLETVLHHPLGTLSFVTRYLGSPIYIMTGESALSERLAQAGGGLFILLSLLPLRRIFRPGGANAIDVALILFLAFIGVTALVTAGGRLGFGLVTAFSGRYTTTSLMGWATLFVLYSPYILSLKLRGPAERTAALLVAIGFTGQLLVYQTVALAARSSELHAREVAALALELNIADHDYLKHVYPNGDVVLALGHQASEANLSVFGLKRYRDLYWRIGSASEEAAKQPCRGYIDAVETIPGEARYARVRGWAYDEVGKHVPGRMEIVGADGLTHGFALGGQRRDDVAAVAGPKLLRSGFVGYVELSALGQPFSVVFDGCQIQHTP